MGEHVIKLPDVGEGVAEAELVEWMVEVGKNVREDEVLAAVMTDKATVEIPSPVEGKVIWLGADIGEVVAVGSPIIRLEVEGAGNVKPGDAPAPEKKAAEEAPKPAPDAAPKVAPAPKPNGAAAPSKMAAPKPATETPAPSSGRPAPSGAPRAEGEKPLASPAVRKRAADAGVDLRRVHGSGPAGRISHEDLDAYFETGNGAAARGTGLVRNMSVKEVPVIGLRRKIAEKMRAAHQSIVPITYVDEVDVTALEDLRAKLNEERREGAA